MSEVPDPTGGWAKATEATGSASKEAITAGRELGRFVSGPAGEIVGMLGDHLKVVRFERQMRLVERVRNFLAERGMDGPTRTIALKIGLPLLDNATLEEENELQDLWATLLVNGGDGDSGIELRRAFVSVLDEMTALDARNLTVIERASPFTLDGSTTGVWVSKLPDLAVPASRRDAEVVNASPTLEILTSISNLERLGCVRMLDGIAPPRAVCLTLFGRAFVQACTFRRTPWFFGGNHHCSSAAGR